MISVSLSDIGLTTKHTQVTKTRFYEGRPGIGRGVRGHWRHAPGSGLPSPGRVT